MLLHLQCNGYGIGLQLPATPDSVRQTFDRLREGLDQDAPVKISGVGSPVSYLFQYIRNADLTSDFELKKLGQLSEMVDGMSAQNQHIFWGALDAESINGLDDVLRVASSLDQYELIQGVTSDKELGGWLVEHGKAEVAFPEEVWPYLDYAGIGAAYYASHGGAYTPNGYVKRREAVQIQVAADRPAFALTLASPTGTCRLDLPASDDTLEQAKRTLGLDDLNGAAIQGVEIDYPWAHLLPNTITLEDANTLAECVRAMSKRELKVFGAALEVEEPHSYYDAGCIAMDIDDYELVDSSEHEYAWNALRAAGASEDALEMLNGYTDFDALGRDEMESDGVRETAFGSVKRLSAPWPRQEPEMGQTMC